MIFCSAAATTRIPKKPSQPTRPPFSTWDKRQQLQKTAFSHWLRAGLLQDHPVVRLFVCSSPCRKWPNTQENGCCLPPSDHIQSKILFQTKQDQERGMNGPASLLHSWHWVLFMQFSPQLCILCHRVYISCETIMWSISVYYLHSAPTWLSYISSSRQQYSIATC